MFKIVGFPETFLNELRLKHEGFCLQFHSDVMCTHTSMYTCVEELEMVSKRLAILMGAFQKCCQCQWVLFKTCCQCQWVLFKKFANANGCFSKMLLMFNIPTRFGSRGHTTPLQLIYFQHGNLYDKEGNASTHLLSTAWKHI